MEHERWREVSVGTDDLYELHDDLSRATPRRWSGGLSLSGTLSIQTPHLSTSGQSTCSWSRGVASGSSVLNHSDAFDSPGQRALFDCHEGSLRQGDGKSLFPTGDDCVQRRYTPPRLTCQNAVNVPSFTSMPSGQQISRTPSFPKFCRLNSGTSASGSTAMQGVFRTYSTERMEEVVRIPSDRETVRLPCERAIKPPSPSAPSPSAPSPSAVAPPPTPLKTLAQRRGLALRRLNTRFTPTTSPVKRSSVVFPLFFPQAQESGCARTVEENADAESRDGKIHTMGDWQRAMRQTRHGSKASIPDSKARDSQSSVDTRQKQRRHAVSEGRNAISKQYTVKEGSKLVLWTLLMFFKTLLLMPINLIACFFSPIPPWCPRTPSGSEPRRAKSGYSEVMQDTNAWSPQQGTTALSLEAIFGSFTP